MKFCGNCGAMLTISGGVYTCPNCSYEESIVDGSYEVRREQPEIKKVYVKKEDSDIPTIKISCPKCGNDRAIVENVATGMGISIVVQKYTCTKCKHSWR